MNALRDVHVDRADETSAIVCAAIIDDLSTRPNAFVPLGLYFQIVAHPDGLSMTTLMDNTTDDIREIILNTLMDLLVGGYLTEHFHTEGEATYYATGIEVIA